MADIDLNDMIESSDEPKQKQKKAHHASQAHSSAASSRTHKQQDVHVRAPSHPSSSAVWVLGIVSVVLLALLVASIFTHGFNAGSGVASSVSTDDAKAKTLAYLKDLVPGQPVTVDSIPDQGSLYSV